jgi:hypothetical protein
MLNLVRRFRAKSQRRRQAYLANLATMSKEERRELEWLEESLKTGSKETRGGADQPWDEKGMARDSN